MAIMTPLPLTTKQLAEIVECYARVFEGWEIVNRQIFSRRQGPIVQYVGFESLRSGAYRPWSAISALPLYTVRMLHQFLDIKHREVLFREHSNQWRDIVVAMEQQFRPSIREPLNLSDIQAMCEQQARESTNDLCMLALLNAYRGNKEQAVSYCERMQELPPPALAPRLDWEQKHKEFGHQLLQAIKAGNERQFLGTV
jgi:hypothetical protein